MENPKSNLTFNDLPVGTGVKVISHCVDFYFFDGETGVVTKNGGRYLGVTVTFDKPRNLKDGTVQEGFNFNPDNLEIICEKTKKPQPKKLTIKMARADQEQLDLMREWFQGLEEVLDNSMEDAEKVGKFVLYSYRTHRIGEYERILLGYETLVENVCDLSLSYLEFKPEIIAALEMVKIKPEIS